MADAYSILRRQRPYIPAINVADIEKTLAVKQSNYDYNTAQVNQAISQFGSIDLIRQEDRDYLYNNLKEVISIVDNSDTIDFSKSGVGSELSGFISKAIDGKVLKQAQNTMAIRKFETGLEALKEENPELYSSINDRDARYMSGYYKYMNGETDTLGSLNYIPFTDVEGKMIKTIKTLKEIYPDQEVEVPLGNGYMQKKKISQLNSYEWKHLLEGSLSNIDRAQLAIDGRNSLGYSNENALKMVESFKAQTEKQYDDLIQQKQSQKLISTDDTTLNNLNLEISNLEKSKKAALAEFDTVGNTAGEIGGYFIEQQMVGGFVNSLSREFDLGFSKDTAYFEKLDAMRKAAEEAAKNNVNTGDMNQDGAPDIYTEKIPVDTENMKIGNLVDNFENDYKKEVDTLRADLSNTYNSLSEEYKKEVDALEKNIIDSYTQEFGEAPSEFVLHRLVVEKAYNVLPANKRVDLLKKIDRVDQYGKAKERAIESASNSIFIEQADDIYEELTDNPKIKMYGLSGGTTTFNQFLKEKGINSTSSLVSFLDSNSDDSKVFKANFLIQTADDVLKVADMIDGTSLSRAVTWDVATRSGLGSAMFGNTSIDDTTMNRLNRAAKLLGEDPSDIFSPDSKIHQMITEVKKEVGGRGGNTSRNSLGVITAGISFAFDPDTTLSQDNVANAFENDKFSEKYEDSLRLSSSTIPGKNMIIVSGKNGKYDVPLHAEIRNKVSSNAEIDAKTPLQLIKDASGNLVVMQLHEYSQTNDGQKEFRNGQRIGLINKGDITLDNMPNLFNYLNFQEGEKTVDYLSEIRSEMPNISFAEDSARSAAGLNNLFPVNTKQGYKVTQMASKGGVIPYLKSQPILRTMNSSPRGSEYYSIVNDVVKNSSKFSVKFDSYDGMNKVAVTMKGKDGNEVVLRRLDVGSNVNNEEFINMYYGAPQVFLTLALEQMGANYLMTDDFRDLETIKNNL